MRYEGVSTLSGGRIGPTFRHAGTKLYTEVGGSGATFEDGTWSADGGGVIGWRPGAFLGLDPELLGNAGLSGAKGSDLGSQASGRLRLHRTVGLFDLFGGGTGGWSDGALGVRGFGGADVGATVGSDARQASLTISPTWVAGARYTDLSVYLRWTGSMTLEWLGGLRRSSGLTTGTEGWVGGSIAVPLGERFSLVGTGGSFPSDPAAGFAGGRFLTLGVRLGRSERSSLRPPRAAAPVRPLPWPEAAFEVIDRGGGVREIVVNAPGATTVEIAGDFTDWTPTPLARDRERWRIRLPLGPGVYRLNLRIDGGAWRVPPGLGRTTDEFGGEAGLLFLD